MGFSKMELRKRNFENNFEHGISKVEFRNWNEFRKWTFVYGPSKIELWNLENHISKIEFLGGRIASRSISILILLVKDIPSFYFFYRYPQNLFFFPKNFRSQKFLTLFIEIV